RFLERRGPKVRVRILDVLVDMTEADPRQQLAASTGQRSRVVGRDRNRRYIRASHEAHDGVVWRVLDDVKGDVAEVALVRHPVTTPDAGSAIAVDVPRKRQA